MILAIAVVSLLVATTSALPQSYDRDQNSGPPIPILRDVRTGPEADGSYTFEFETGDGISRHEQGQPGPEGAVVSQGGWSFTFPDGSPAQVSFVADEFGYRPESPLIPTPHPLPAHALEQIAHAEREKDAGIFHGGQYNPEEHQRPSRPSGGRQQYN